MLKVFGLLVLIGSLPIILVGAGGAVMNFVFPPNELVCQFAEDDFKKAQEAVKRLERVKGTSEEAAAKIDADVALNASEASSDMCGRAKASHRFYGTIFAVVGVLGLIGFFLGAVLTFFGFRKRKMA